LHLNLSLFFNELHTALQLKKPFVVYKKPNKSKLNLIIPQISLVNDKNAFVESGFIFAPFSDSDDTIFFPLQNSLQFSAIFSEESNVESAKITRIVESNISAEKAHIKLVENTIDFIKKNNLKKIVISRKEIIKVSQQNCIEWYKKMCILYPSAFTYIFYHPKTGIWMGSTPEKLLSIKNTLFKTMSLAGTQTFKNGEDTKWTSKEIEEQDIVTQYILGNLQNIVKIENINGPYTQRAGNLVHLRTDISGILPKNYNLKNIIYKLHPTPAVCGLPKNRATEFIVENEGYNRQYYTGFLGEINIKNKTNLFVNLRSMQVIKNEISLFIGGGITAESSAFCEWQETVSKSQTMKGVLK
jgi:isochorismate synthase